MNTEKTLHKNWYFSFIYTEHLPSERGCCVGYSVFKVSAFYSNRALVFPLLPHREPNGYRSAQGGSMMPNTMRQQGMGGPNPNAQMNMNTGGGMGMGGMGGMSRGFGMSEQGHMGHMGPMGSGSMYGGSGGGGNGGGGMGNRMMQMNQMGQMNQVGHMNQMNQMGPMNHPGQGMQQHPQQPPFQSSGGFGLSGMNSPSGSPRMGGPQQGLLMSPRNRGSPKMGANQFSPGGKSISV